MAFESWSDFLSMGTHGPYVWSVYGVSFALLFGITIQTVISKRSQLKKLRLLSLGQDKSHASS